MRLLLLFIGVVTWHATSSNAKPRAIVNGTSATTVISQSSNTFGNSLFKEIIATNPFEDFIYSPLSAFIAMSMVTQGAKGKTRSQLLSALNWNGKAGRLAPAMKSLIDFHNSFTEVELNVANKIFLSSEYSLKKQFGGIMKDYYHSRVKSVKFQENHETSETINKWVSKATNNRITDVSNPDDLDGNTAMVIVSTIYFNGKWIDEFAVAETKLRPFHIDNFNSKNIATMFISGSYQYGTLPRLNAKFIQLPYQYKNLDHALSMFIILPNRVDGLAKLEKDLNGNVFQQLFNGEYVVVDLYLPKFKVESDIDLKGPLSKMNLSNIFTSSANFTGITNGENLKIDEIRQKAIIEVGELGTEAAAATSVALSDRFGMSEPTAEFKADHPFLYVIMSHITKTVLFQGHVTFSR